MEVLSSSNPVPGFQGGTVRHTAVTKMEKIVHGFGHYSSYTFIPYMRGGTDGAPCGRQHIVYKVI